MQNEPQLSAEEEKIYQEFIKLFDLPTMTCEIDESQKRVVASLGVGIYRQALATALEEQEEKHRKRRTKWAFKTAKLEQKARVDERQKVLDEVLELPSMKRELEGEGAMMACERNQLRAELRAKLVEMKEGK